MVSKEDLDHTVRSTLKESLVHLEEEEEMEVELLKVKEWQEEWEVML